MAPHKEPQRTCVACRGVRDKGDLIRIVAGPEGRVIVDMSERKQAPGRGAYVCLDEACFKKALTTGALKRALKVRS